MIDDEDNMKKEEEVEEDDDEDELDLPKLTQLLEEKKRHIMMIQEAETGNVTKTD